MPSVTPAVVFGVPLDSLTMESTLDRISDLVSAGRRSKTGAQVATVNVDFLVNALSHPDLMGLLQSSALNLADGMPVLWAASLLGTPLPERVAGSDLVPRLAAESGARNWKIHLLGGAPGVAQRALAQLRSAYPDADITAETGPMIADVTDADTDLLDRIVERDPDILCVAYGNPKQERFIAANAQRLRCPVMIGIGGSLDMLVGDKRRAPELAQRLGLEWVFRAAQEPGRLGARYAHDVRVFGPAFLAYRRAVRRHRDGSGVSVRVDAQGGVQISAARTTPADLPTLPHGITSVRIDLSGADSLCATGHGALVGALRCAQRDRASVDWTGVSRSLQRCLRDYGTQRWIERVAMG